MPRIITISPELATVLARQDNVVTVAQLTAHGVSRTAVDKRVARHRWRRLLPGLFLTSPLEPSRRQLVIAAWLWSGPTSAIDGPDALRWYGDHGIAIRSGSVHVVVPADSHMRSFGFVVVRRAAAEIEIGGHGAVPYVDRATAAVVAARNLRDGRAAIALLSRLLQEGAVTVAALERARERIGDKWCRPVDGALLAVGVGVRSPAEEDMRRLILTSPVLPEPLWNQWLELPDGGPPVCVDGLWVDAGLVNEVIGKKYHAWGEQYDDTNARKERLQAAGLVVTEATPIRIRRQGSVVLANLKQTYGVHAGRGMPPGVLLVDPPAIAA